MGRAGHRPGVFCMECPPRSPLRRPPGRVRAFIKRGLTYQPILGWFFRPGPARRPGEGPNEDARCQPGVLVSLVQVCICTSVDKCVGASERIS